MSDATIPVGGIQWLSATIAPENATDKSVIWSSSNSAIATVGAATGKVNGIAVGEAMITATALDGSGVTGSCKVTVEALD